MLPKELTTQSVREASDEADASLDSKAAIEDAMNAHFEDVVAILTEQFDLTDEQAEALTERICWRLELLPE